MALAIWVAPASSNTGHESLSANPTTNLPDTGLTTVAVSGSSFVAGAGVQVQQCSSVPGTALCTALVDVAAAQDGSFATSVQVSYDMHGFAPSDGPFCDTSPTATCDLEAVYTSGGSGVGATVPLTFAGHVSTGNVAPVADDQSVSTDANTPVQITLTASDANGDPLTYRVVADPSDGALTGTPPNLTYTPDTGFKGVDSFTFTANDGHVDSNIATVTIGVETGNGAPVADSQSVQAVEDTPISILLTGSDPNGDPLTYDVVDPPANGALTGAPPNLTYTPSSNYNGADSFTFETSDGILTSSLATVSISVAPVNDPPSVSPFSLTTPANTSITTTLTATDPDSAQGSITYTIVQPPQHGTATLSGSQLTYVPAKNYAGSDSLTYAASDGQATSSPASVSISVVHGAGQGKSGGGKSSSAYVCFANPGIPAAGVKPRIVGEASAWCYLPGDPNAPVGTLTLKGHIQVLKKGSWVTIANKTWTGSVVQYEQVAVNLKAACTSGQTKRYRVIARVTQPSDTGVVDGSSQSLTCS